MGGKWRPSLLLIFAMDFGVFTWLRETGQHVLINPMHALLLIINHYENVLQQVLWPNCIFVFLCSLSLWLAITSLFYFVGGVFIPSFNVTVLRLREMYKLSAYDMKHEFNLIRSFRCKWSRFGYIVFFGRFGVTSQSCSSFYSRSVYIWAQF